MNTKKSDDTIKSKGESKGETEEHHSKQLYEEDVLAGKQIGIMLSIGFSYTVITSILIILFT